jgi:hypothetical protein
LKAVLRLISNASSLLTSTNFKKMTNFKNALLFATITCIFAVGACVNKTEDLPLNTGQNFFPLKKGKYIVYDVDSITYDLLNAGQHTVDTDTASFQVKELVADTLKDAQGRPSYKIEYYTRKDASHTWLIRKVWFATRTDAGAERIEDNQRFVKLTFPIQNNTHWSCVRHLDSATNLTIRSETLGKVYENWRSAYSNIDKPHTQGTKTFDSTLTVVHTDFDAKTNKRYYKEIYARNVGLVYKRFEILETQCLDPVTCSRANASWRERAEKGFVLEMRLKEFN